jgi:hypothetical protein
LPTLDGVSMRRFVARRVGTEQQHHEHANGIAVTCSGRNIALPPHGNTVDLGQRTRKSVAIYGGSFDRPHVSHVLAAVYALKMGGADFYAFDTRKRLAARNHPEHEALLASSAPRAVLAYITERGSYTSRVP